MTWLVTMGLTNAALAVPLAALALAVSRWSRRPALAHILWVLVLLKLLTPPMVEIPVGWKIDPARYGWQLPAAPSRPIAVQGESPPRAGSPSAVVTGRSADFAANVRASSPVAARRA